MKLINPTTSSQRHLMQTDRKDLLNKKPTLKIKIKGFQNSLGKNHKGRITSYHKGGGHKRKYRLIDFYRNRRSSAIITSIEYDPYRNSFIASAYDFNKKRYYYIIAPLFLSVGDIVKSGKTHKEQNLAYSLPMSKIPENKPIYNVALDCRGMAKFTRSAGTCSFITYKSADFCIVRLNSGKESLVSSTGYASIGIVSNTSHILSTLGKAGRSRWLNRRPTVRGVAMNPVDHPNGGGEGKKSGKGYSPWGKPKKNIHTYHKRKIRNEIEMEGA